MSSIISRIHYYATNIGEKVALRNPNARKKTMTYRELYCSAVSLAEYISSRVYDNEPIIVYGHKDPYMIVSFLACVLSGHAYCPIDKTMPLERVEMVLNQTRSSMVMATETIELENTMVIDYDQIVHNSSSEYVEVPDVPNSLISEDDDYYIIFTSGSTGQPKGVEISFRALNNFLKWSCTLGAEHKYSERTIFLNQAPFSFDLSVMDLYTSLYCGATLCMMNKDIQSNLGEIVPYVKENDITAFVSTPSFVNMCMVDQNFCHDILPKIDTFFFCGETLSNKTAKKLIKRFPDAVIQNTYGPTESTVAVSGVRITRELVDSCNPLPVGIAKPGTGLLIDPDGGVSKTGEKTGEILITGDTLANGYYKNLDNTNKSFIKYHVDGKETRAYRTGDNGYLKGDMLYYNGRIDLQIKLNGYRIELGDVESSILKIPNVDDCAVIPKISEGKVKALVGVIVVGDDNDNIDIRRELEKVLPAYMIPQRYLYLDKLPMTNNGKVDRKKLSDIVEEE